MLISNTIFPSVSFFDFYKQLLSDISSYELLPVKQTSLFSAKKFAQYLEQKDTYTYQIPLLALVTSTIQMDERAQLSWQAISSPEYIKSAGGTILKMNDIGIYYSPVQLTGTFEISYIGTSMPQLIDFQLHMNRLFKIQKYVKYKVLSNIVLPETMLQNLFPGEDLDRLVEEGTVPYVTLDLTGDKRYVLPFTYNVLVRLTGQSDQSKLFGDTELPEYISSLSFEFITTFPHSLMFEIGSRVNMITLNIGINEDLTPLSTSCVFDRLNDRILKGIFMEFIVTEQESDIKFSSNLITDENDVEVICYDNYYGVQTNVEYSLEESDEENEYILHVNIPDYIDGHTYILYTKLA